MKYSTTRQLAERYRAQIDAEFRHTAAQVTDTTKAGRSVRLRHLAKLSKKVQDRGRMVLRAEGVV